MLGFHQDGTQAEHAIGVAFDPGSFQVEEFDWQTGKGEVEIVAGSLFKDLLRENRRLGQLCRFWEPDHDVQFGRERGDESRVVA